MLLEDAKKGLWSKLFEGEHCPCCGQFAKVYKRPLNSSMVRSLILIERYFRANPQQEWLHVPSYLTSQRINTSNDGTAPKLRFWGLLEAKKDVRDDGSDRVGFYKITPLGREFVYGRRQVPKFIFLYNQQLLGLSDGVYAHLDVVDVQRALGTHFNYSELMRGV